MADYWKEIEAQPPAASIAGNEVLVPTNKSLARRTLTAATWWWVMTGLSAANLLLAYVRAPIRSTFSFFISEFAYEIGRAGGNTLPLAALGFVVVVMGGAVWLGFLMKRYATWAFIAVLAFLGGDAVLIYFLTTLAGVWPFIFHGVVIYFVVLGLKSARLYNERRAKGQV
jgi:hypothetical protein